MRKKFSLGRDKMPRALSWPVILNSKSDYIKPNKASYCIVIESLEGRLADTWAKILAGKSKMPYAIMIGTVDFIITLWIGVTHHV